MKAMMSQHVERVRHQMFNDSTNAVKKSLKKLIKDIEDFLLGKADEVFMSVKRDYESVVLGRKSSSHQLSRGQRQIRTEVTNLVEGTEMDFKKVVGVEPETPRPSVAELEEKETPPKPDLVRQDAAMDDIEQVEANKVCKTDDEDNVFKSAIRADGTTTRPSLTHRAEPETAKNDSTLADAEVGEGQGSSAFETATPSAEASNVLDIPTAPAKRRSPPDDSGHENEWVESQSMSANDLDRATDGKAPESSPHGERASSVASWVQSWFSPRK